MVNHLTVRRLSNGFLISYSEGDHNDPFGSPASFTEAYAETAEQMATTVHEAMYINPQGETTDA